MAEKYYPRYLGIVTPKGDDICEFLITGDEEMGVLASVATIFASHKVNMNMVSCYQMNEGRQFVLNIYADFAKAEHSIPQLVEELKKIRAVRTVEADNTSQSLFDSFLFPIMMARDMRALVMIASAMVSVETHFGRSLGQQGKHLVFESAKQAGLVVLKETRRQAPKSSTAKLIAHIEDRLRAAGWGLFSFETSEVENGSVDVTVLHPIFSETDDVQESWYTYGLAAGLMEGIFGSPLVLASSSYKRDTKSLSFRLQEQTSNSRQLKGMR